MVTKIINKNQVIHGLSLGTACDRGCRHAKDLFYGKIYCKKYGWIFKGSNCKNYKPRS